LKERERERERERESKRMEGGAEGDNLQADSPLSMEPDSVLSLMTREIMT